MSATQDWLEWRRHGIGASDIAAAWTRSYGKTSRAIVANKLGLTPPQETTQAMQAGHDWEHRIANAVHALTGFHVAGEQTQAEHPTEPWMRATTDGFLLANADDPIDQAAGLLEIKTTRNANWAYYGVQVQWQMIVTGADLAVVAVLNLDDDTRLSNLDGGLEVLVERSGRLSLDVHRADPAVQAELADFGRTLWAHIQAGTLPAIEADDLPAINAENPHATNTNAADLTDHQDVLVQYARLKAAEKAASTETKRLAAILTNAIGPHETGTVHGVEWITRKESKPNTKTGRTTRPLLIARQLKEITQ